jgi:chaperone LolA
MRALLACLAIAVAAPVQAASLERFHAFVRSTQSASADFAQKMYDRNSKLVQESSGSFVFQRPGRFRWTYAKPYAQIIVGDGEKVWIYDQDLNQVVVRKLASAIGSTPAALLAGSAEIEQAFELAEAGGGDGLEWLEARPRVRESGFERIRMGFGVAGIEAMELVDPFGQTTVLRFSSLSRNPRLDPSTFRFTPPKGVDVLGE